MHMAPHRYSMAHYLPQTIISVIIIIIKIFTQANLKYILVSPYPTLFLRYGSVGRIFFFFFYSQIKDPSTFPVNRPNIAIKLNTNNVFQCKFVIKSSNSLGNKILYVIIVVFDSNRYANDMIRHIESMKKERLIRI